MERMRGFISGRQGLLRLLTVLFSFALLLGAIGPGARAAPPEEDIPTVYPVSDHKPQITIQANGVVDAAGKLTGFVEVALLVRTSVYYDTAAQVTLTQAEYDAAVAGGAIPAGEPGATIALRRHKFQTVSVALEYNTSILTPVDWRVESADSALSTGEGAVDVTGATLEKRVAVETAKPTNMITSTAQIGGYDGASQTAVLSMTAQAMAAGMEFDEPTAVLMVRFAYDLTVMANEALMKAPAGAPQLLGPKFAESFDSQAIWFAPDLKAAPPPTDQIVWYEGTVNESNAIQTRFYAYQNQPATQGTGPSPAGDIPYPDTAGLTVLTEDASAGPGGYSYTENLLPFNGPHELISFTHVNLPSYLAGGTNLDDVIAIVFYDWDDTLIGVLNVPRGDVRKQVNEYVEANFIHPDLRASNPANASLPGYFDNSWTGGGESGLDRKYTYRGKYPSEPGGAISDPTGEEYPLTNKLDYTFYKRATALTAEVYDATQGSEKYNRYWTLGAIPTSDYPYIHGWAVVDDMRNTGAVWTTFGVGELGDLNPKTAAANPMPVFSNPTVPDPVEQTTYHFKTGGDGTTDYFRFADFSDLSKDKAPQNYIAVKAVYEPGTSLLGSIYPYSLHRGASYTRYNPVDSTSNGAYSIKLAYSRTFNSSGAIYGVTRIRDAAVRLQIVPDLLPSGLENDLEQFFFQNVSVENKEIVEVDMIVSAGVHAIDYILKDTYDVNVVGGADRSAQNVDTAQVPTNYLYSDMVTPANRQGALGFVFEATMGVAMEQGTLRYYGMNNTYSTHIQLGTIVDLNLKADMLGTAFTAGDYTIAADKIYAAVVEALTCGDPSWINPITGYPQMTFHELQWYLINGTLEHDNDPNETNLVHTYPWCRQHERCLQMGAGTPTTIQTLFEAAEAYRSGNTATLDNLTAGDVALFTFARDASGARYTGPTAVSDFIVDVLAAYDAAIAGGFIDSSLIKWSQIQNYILTGGFQSASVTDPIGKADYWWRGGWTVGTSWNDMISAARTVHSITAGHVGESYLDWYAAFDEAAASWETSGLSLAKADETVYTVYSEFRDAMIAAVADFPAATYPNVSWDQIQYYIIHGGAVVGDAVAFPESCDYYWWYAGGMPLDGDSTLLDLLRAAERAALGRASILNTLNEALLYSNPSFGFRATFAGVTFADTVSAGEPTVDALKGMLKGFVTLRGDYETLLAANGGPEWNYVQYYIIRGAVAAGTTYNTEGNSYYWWNAAANPNAAAPAALTETNVDQLIDAIAKTAYRAVINGHPNPWVNLNESVIERARLAKDWLGTENAFPVDFGRFLDSNPADISAFIDFVEAMVEEECGLYSSGAPPPMPDFDWRQVQHYLLTGDYLDLSDGGLPGDGSGGYWWKSLNNNPATSKSYLEELVEAMEAYAVYLEHGGSATLTTTYPFIPDFPALTEKVEELYVGGKLNIYVASALPATNLMHYTPSPPVANMRTQTIRRVALMVQALKGVAANNAFYSYDPSGNGGAGEATITISWYHLQMYAFNFNNCTATTVLPTTQSAKNTVAAMTALVAAGGPADGHFVLPGQAMPTYLPVDYDEFAVPAELGEVAPAEEEGRDEAPTPENEDDIPALLPEPTSDPGEPDPESPIVETSVPGPAGTDDTNAGSGGTTLRLPRRAIPLKFLQFTPRIMFTGMARYAAAGEHSLRLQYARAFGIPMPRPQSVPPLLYGRTAVAQRLLSFLAYKAQSNMEWKDRKTAEASIPLNEIDKISTFLL